MSAMKARLSLELLDSRNAPSDLSGNAVATTAWMSDPSEEDPLPAYSGKTRTNPPKNAAPVIVDFVVTVGVGHLGHFSGRVQDETPGGLTVTLSGIPACVDPDVTVTTDANGNFSFEGQLRPQQDSGYTFADVTDAHGVAAQTADYLLYC